MWGSASSIRTWRSARAPLLLLALAPLPAAAADIRITTSVGSSVTATDNVDLEPHDQAKDGLILTNSASLGVSSTGARFKGALDYTLNLESTFSDRTDVRVFNDLAALGTFEVVPDLFFIQSRAFAGQQLGRANGRVSASGRNTGSDVNNVYSFSVSPFFRFRLGTWADAEVGADYERVFEPGNNNNNNANNNNETGDSENISQHATISSVGKLARTNLTAQFQHDVVHAEGPNNFSEQTTGLTTAEYAVIPEFSFLGTVGYEAIDTTDVSGNLSGVVLLGGFDARPGPRSELRFSAGNRFDRLVYDALASYKISAHALFRATYDVTFVPAQGGALSLPTNITLDKNGDLVDVTTGLPVNQADLGLGLQQDPYIANRAEASLVSNYARDQFSLIGTFEHQDFLNVQPNEDVLYATGHWTHALSPNLRVGGTLGYRFTDVAGGERDDTFLGRIDLSYDLAENATVYTAYSFTRRISNIPTEEYTENALTIGGILSF
jgi:uncharacterized protein (PEP-CTERM system associated)